MYIDIYKETCILNLMYIYINIKIIINDGLHIDCSIYYM